MEEKERLQLKFVTPIFRASYAALIEPKRNLAGDLEYSIEMVFEPNTDFSEMKQCILNACIVKFGPDQSKWPKPFRVPLRDGNLERTDNSMYENRKFAKCHSRDKPQIVNASLQEIIDPTEIYSGIYARASIFPYVYTQPSAGVSFLMNNVMKIKDGDRLDGKASAQDDFESYKSEGSAPVTSGIDIFS